MFRTVLALIAGGIAATFVATSAFAAKPQPTLAEIQCGDASYTAMVTDNSNEHAMNSFTPAHLTGGGVLIPVAFSNQHSTFTDNEGNVFEQDDPDVSHPMAGHKDLISCHFTVSFQDDSGSGSFEGDVVGFLAGRR